MLHSGIISVTGHDKSADAGNRPAAEYTLAPEFMEGYGWMKKMKVRRSKTKKATKKKLVTKQPKSNIGTDLLEQVVNMYEANERLTAVVTKLTNEVLTLGSQKEVLSNNLIQTQHQLEEERCARKNDTDSIAALELRLREVMTPVAVKRIRFDGNGVQI